MTVKEISNMKGNNTVKVETYLKEYYNFDASSYRDNDDIGNPNGRSRAYTNYYIGKKTCQQVHDFQNIINNDKQLHAEWNGANTIAVTLKYTPKFARLLLTRMCEL